MKKIKIFMLVSVMLIWAGSSSAQRPGLLVPPTRARQASNSDQSIISGRLLAENLENRTFIFSSPFTDFNNSVKSLTLLPGGKVQSKDTNVTRWEIGRDNSLRFFLVDELRATFRYRESEHALIAEPIILGKQAYIRLRLAR